jgi:DNA-binding transcriptional MocR family regulator
MRDPSPWSPRFAEGPGTLADRLARAIAEDIAQGHLPRGTRLPAHRALAADLGTSVVTVGRAYALLEKRGLVRGEHGRGTFVAGLGPGGAGTGGAMPTMEAGTAERGLADLSLNLPPVTLTRADFAQAVATLAETDRLPDPARYPPCAGSLSLRRAAAVWFGRHRPTAPANGVLMTNGAQQAITIAFILGAEPGRAVITEAVTYPGAIIAAGNLGRPLVGVAMDGEGMIPDGLDAALSRNPGALIYLTPVLHNPTGATMGRERRLDILSVARKHGAQVVEDDAYGVLKDDPPATLYHLDPERVWYVNSFSKPLSALLRLGILVPPRGREVEATRGIQGASWTAAPLPAAILELWLEDGTADRSVAALKGDAMARMDLLRRILPGVVPPGHRAFHAWIPLSESRAERICRWAATEGITLTPPLAPVVDAGLAMGLRLCLGAPDHGALTRALETLRDLLARREDGVYAMV